MPLFMLVYFIWIPHRLPMALPPMIASMVLGVVGLAILATGKIYAAGQGIAAFSMVIIIGAQFTKLAGDYFTAYSTFVYLFAIPILIIGLFGRRRYIIPVYAIMVAADLLFYFLLNPRISGEYLVAAQVGLMTSLIALTITATLLFLLRNIMDSALAEVERTSSSMNRFVPTEFLQLLNRRNIHEVGLGDHAEHEMTILFADIRNFTGISETLTPADNFSFINDYLSVMGPIIRENGGFIDKYIGDAILALFFKPADAARAAVAMQAMLQRFNEQFIDGIFPQIKIGIGIHTGRLMLGTIGEVRRMENTVISDAVNVASRVEHLTKRLGASILITGAALNQIENGEHKTRLVDIVKLRGKSNEIDIFEILDMHPEETQLAYLAYADELHDAIVAIKDNQNHEATEKLHSLKQKNSADNAISYHLQKIAKITFIERSRKMSNVRT